VDCLIEKIYRNILETYVINCFIVKILISSNIIDVNN